MPTPKTIAETLSARPTIEGAGVRLHRGFANPEVPRFDPFLLFDDFSGSKPADYVKGFPWHPHRGIETVTYVLKGDVRHHDSIGNDGMISSGDVQWMTAGNGILHEEMPEGTSGMQGFQLWVNLPKEHKMTTPRYRDIGKKIIPETAIGAYATARVITGSVGDIHGPVTDVFAQPLYIDVPLQPNKEFSLPIPTGYNTFIYIIDGAVGVGSEGGIDHKHGNIILFSRTGDTVTLRAGSAGARFLLASGKPLNEPVAWYGPIVMNTDNEIETAFMELQIGSFIKNGA